MLVLACGVAKHIPADRIDVSIGVEKANDLVWLLKRLDGRVEKHPIEAMLSIPRTSLKSDLGTTGNLWHAFIFGAVMLFVKRRSDHVSGGGVTMSEEVQPKPVRTTSSMRRVGIYAGLLLVVFLLGFVPIWLKSREYSSRLSEVEHRLGIALIENTLASAVIDARRGDYESARQAASLFFNSLRAETDKGNESALSQAQREGLRPLFIPRDEIITLLARGEPASADRLSELYVSYRRIMNR